MRVNFGALRTRVARRILFLFLLCAILPVSILSVLSYFSVRNELLVGSRSRLESMSRNARDALVERFQFLESTARLVLTPSVGSEARLEEETPTGWRQEGRLEGFQAAMLTRPGAAPQPLFGEMGPVPDLSPEEIRHLEEGLSLLLIQRNASGEPRLLLAVDHIGADGADSRLWTLLNQEFLWRTALEYSSSASLAGFCVLEEDHSPLFCTVPDPDSFLRTVVDQESHTEAGAQGQSLQVFEWTDSDGEEYFAGNRHVFLRPQFFLPGLEVSVSESKASALSAMNTFGSAFWRVLLMGLVAVALLSHVQIRKSLDPIEALQKGTQRVAGGNFRERVSVETKDEFEDLADSFNSMATHLESQFQALATIGEIDRAILSALESDRIIETALHRIVDILPCDTLAVCRLEWHEALEGRLRVSDSSGTLGQERKVILDSEDRSFLGEIRESDILLDGDVASQYFGVGPGETPIGSAILAPLRTQEGLAGYLAVGRLDGAPFSDREQFRAERIAKQISIALGNAWLLEELDRMSWGALTALARTIDAKSPWTSGHSENVATLSVAIGRGMGLDEQTLTALQRGGLVHDIGKIAVPGSVLDKNGKLTPEERELVETHPEAGVRILEPVPGMEPILPMVLHHHESWDGSGYPMGLAGEAIPLGARIMAVADQFDALSSDRPYRPGRGVEGAVDFLRSQAGTGLDSAIVDVFINLLQAGDLPGLTPIALETPS